MIPKQNEEGATMDEADTVRQWRTISEEELAVLRRAGDERKEREHIQTIELDCPPGWPRPSELITGVLEGTGLTAGPPKSTFFGNWTWEFSMPREEWQQRIQPIVAPRIKDLYRRGLIRYGSW